MDNAKPKWHVEAYPQNLTTNTLLAMYGRSDGILFAVGVNGTILTKLADGWQLMASPTSAHLTAITGVENGSLFGLANNADGEMWAVGWQGTVLHYHPNPDGDPNTNDGAWQIIAAPEGAALVPVLRPDPACLDFDGDGIPDDGDASGWAGDAPCKAGNTTLCDDNCRDTANGTARPLADPTGGACLASGTACSAAATAFTAACPAAVPAWVPPAQQDTNGDGVGDACQSAGAAAAPAPAFRGTLFGLWAQATGNNVQVIAVGEAGAVVTYSGTSAAKAPTAPALPMMNPRAWTAETGVAFRYDDDCAALPALGCSHLPPQCPAFCSPLLDSAQLVPTCSCPLTQNQCCDAAACQAGACDGTGYCTTYCVNCFRHLDQTLYAVYATGNQVVAVGANGTAIVNDPTTLSNPATLGTSFWHFPFCLVVPPPLDLPHRFAAIADNGANLVVVGQQGAVVNFSYASGNCPYNPLLGGPAGFLSGAHYVGGPHGTFAVGDEGLLLQIQATYNNSPLTTIATGVKTSFNAVWSITNSQNEPEAWLVGADGNIVRAVYY